MEKYKEQIEEIVETLNLGITRSSNESLQMICPFHEESEPSFGINVKTGAYNCFACYERGHISKLGNYLRGHIVSCEIQKIMEYKIKTLIDEVGYIKKPKKDMGNITNRINESNFVEYSIKEIIDSITDGHTIVPSGAKANKEWRHQQMVMLDFDNKNTNYTKSEVLTFAKEINLLPTFSYYTFSNTSEKEKFRFVYCFKDEITDKSRMECIIDRLLYSFKKYEPDIQCKQLCSKFLGTNNKDIQYSNYIYEEDKRFTKEQLDKVEEICKENKGEEKELNTINSITAKELLKTELEPLPVIVDNMLCAGFSIMAGAPKVRQKLGLLKFMY